jgi:hypothetical protein
VWAGSWCSHAPQQLLFAHTHAERDATQSYFKRGLDEFIQHLVEAMLILPKVELLSVTDIHGKLE